MLQLLYTITNLFPKSPQNTGKNRFLGLLIKVLRVAFYYFIYYLTNYLVFYYFNVNKVWSGHYLDILDCAQK